MGATRGTRIYAIAWAVLLALTVVMLALESAAMPRGLFVSLMIAAMLTKASIIGAYFMHLRTERGSLVAMVVIGLGVVAVALFALIVPDALRIQDLAGQAAGAG